MSKKWIGLVCALAITGCFDIDEQITVSVVGVTTESAELRAEMHGAVTGAADASWAIR